jgi:hypothetical protein
MGSDSGRMGYKFECVQVAGEPETVLKIIHSRDFPAWMNTINFWMIALLGFQEGRMAEKSYAENASRCKNLLSKHQETNHTLPNYLYDLQVMELKSGGIYGEANKIDANYGCDIRYLDGYGGRKTP